MKRTLILQLCSLIQWLLCSKTNTFSQLTAFLNRTQFNNYVRKYDGNRYGKHFNLLESDARDDVSQLSNESLRLNRCFLRRIGAK